MATVFVALGVVCAAPSSSAQKDEKRDLVVADWTQQAALRAANLSTTWKGADFFLGEWNAAQKASARASGVRFDVILAGIPEDEHLFLFELDDQTEKVPDQWRDRVLYEQGRKIVVGMGPREAEVWMDRGFHGVWLPRKPEGWAGPREVAFNCNTTQPLISTLLTQTNRPQWIDWIQKISGMESVNIGGINQTIVGRNSKYLLTGDPQNRAYEYARSQMVAWNYSGANLEDDPFTTYATNPNLQNLVVTIPGQTNPSRYIVFSAHYDSRQQTDPTPTPSSPAPGADDNGTGTATVFEAARILRQFRFERSIRLILFTGEEQGLIGSAAYCNDHVMTTIDGVVNIDMMGYDANNDRCFEIHIGTLPQSLDVGNCFSESITAYGMGLTRDFLTTGATDRSDHASFWSKNVGAIEIAENFFSNSQTCSGSEPNPNYHTTGDTLANMQQTTSFDIAKTALATVAAMAVPISKCFADTPALTATPMSSAVGLSWTAVPGAANYRVLRSTQGCEGQWLEQAITSGTTYNDANVTQGVTYQYQVEAIHSDGFCVSSPSTCQSAAAMFFDPSVSSYSVIDTCASGGPGNGNGVIEPGETVTIPITLQNLGNVTMTSLNGTLLVSTPGITVSDPSASWPDLAPAASAQSIPDHFSLSLDASVACGQPIANTLQIGYAEGLNNRSVALNVGTSGISTPIQEGFGGGIPATWTVVNGGAGGGTAATWSTADPGFRGIGAPMTAPYAIVDSDKAGSGASQDESLVSPLLNVTGCNPLTLQFTNQFRYFSGGTSEKGDVDVSTDGGTNWTNVLRLQLASDGYPTPNTKTVNLTSAVAANPANVKLRFRYWSSSFDYWWAIDNVQLTCSAPSCTPCVIAPPAAPGEAGQDATLRVDKSGADLQISWGPPNSPCTPATYALYRGDLNTLASATYSHDTALSCSASAGSLTIAPNDPQLGDADYFLAVAETATQEGSYGKDSSNTQRPVSANACKPAQNLGACSP